MSRWRRVASLPTHSHRGRQLQNGGQLHGKRTRTRCLQTDFPRNSDLHAASYRNSLSACLAFGGARARRRAMFRERTRYLHTSGQISNTKRTRTRDTRYPFPQTLRWQWTLSRVTALSCARPPTPPSPLHPVEIKSRERHVEPAVHRQPIGHRAVGRPARRIGRRMHRVRRPSVLSIARKSYHTIPSRSEGA